MKVFNTYFLFSFILAITTITPGSALANNSPTALTLYFLDSDGDGFGDPSITIEAETQPAGYVDNGNDCDDSDGIYYPGAFEACGDPDYNCDGVVEVAVTYYKDNDGDGFGDANNSIVACEQPAFYVTDNTDCNDSNGNTYPGAPEGCGFIDYNCDGIISEPTDIYYIDDDGDGFGDPNFPILSCGPAEDLVKNADDCDDTDASYNPDAIEVCGDPDYNCDGETSDPINVYYADIDGDGFGDANDSIVACERPEEYVENNRDCDDTDALYNPDAIEVCGNPDYNCDGETNDTTDLYYADTDGDGYGDPNAALSACEAPAGYVANNTDCDDTDALYNPGATEVCGNPDYNCDGVTSDPTDVYYADTDGDGFGDPATAVAACDPPAGYVDNGNDCDDSDGIYYPGAFEACGDPDYNCDGILSDACCTERRLERSARLEAPGDESATLTYELGPGVSDVTLGLRGMGSRGVGTRRSFVERVTISFTDGLGGEGSLVFRGDEVNRTEVSLPGPVASITITLDNADIGTRSDRRTMRIRHTQIRGCVAEPVQAKLAPAANTNSVELLTSNQEAPRHLEEETAERVIAQPESDLGQQARHAPFISLQVYPNPTSTYFSVDLNDQISGTMQLVSSLGKVIRTIPVGDSQQLSVNVADVNPGTYYLRVVTINNQVITKPIIVLR